MTSSSRTLSMLLRRAPAAASQRSFHASAVQLGGMTPPLPPFARIPRRSEPMVENSDAVWDDGVAPELALDFDAPHISSKEALYTWVAAFAGFGLLYGVISVTTAVANQGNPALPHSVDVVDKDYTNHAATPLEE